VKSSSLLPLLLQITIEDSMTCSTEEEKNSLIVFKYGRCSHSDNRGIHFITLQRGNL